MIFCSCHGLQGCVPVAASRMSRSAASRKRRVRKSRWRASASASVVPRPERISISDEMSSPAIDSESTWSVACAASRSSSKRWASERVPGSRIPNSSSIPTVKSSEVSKTSLVPAVSTGLLGEVEVERVEVVHRRARRVDRHVRRHLEQRLRVVEDDLHSRLDEVVRNPLRRLGGHREHSHHDVLILHHPVELVVGAHREPPRLAVRADGLPDLALVDVEDRHDSEPVVGEDVRAGDRLAEVAGAEQRDVVLARGAQDLADLRHQRVDVVAHAALAELAEARQVAPDLGGVDVRVVGELLGGDRLLPHLLRLGEDLEVTREPGCNAQRQPLAALGHLQPALQRVVEGHGSTLSSALVRAAGSTKNSKRSTPSTATTGMRSPYSRLSPGSSVTSTSLRPNSRSRRTRSIAWNASSQRWQPGLP